MIYVMLAEGFEEIEALAFTDILRRADITVQTVSVGNGNVVTGSHNIKVTADINISDIDKTEITGVVLPGGLPGAYNLRDSSEVKNLISYAVDNNCIVGAICASPYIVLEQLGFTEGIKLTVNPAFYNDVKIGTLVKERVCSDGLFITSQSAGTTHEFAKAFIDRIKSEQVSDKLLSEMLYK